MTLMLINSGDFHISFFHKPSDGYCETSSQAPSYARRLQSETMNHLLAHSLTGVKCRATSVAKKGEPSVVAGYIEPAWLENGFETELGTFKFEVG